MEERLDFLKLPQNYILIYRINLGNDLIGNIRLVDGKFCSFVEYPEQLSDGDEKQISDYVDVLNYGVKK